MEDQTQPTIELNVSVQPFDLSKGELIDAIASSSKLTKADAGKAAPGTDEDWLNVTIEASEANPNIVIPKVTVNYHRKVSFAADNTGN
jgi:hypothetical protein